MDTKRLVQSLKSSKKILNDNLEEFQLHMMLYLSHRAIFRPPKSPKDKRNSILAKVHLFTFYQHNYWTKIADIDLESKKCFIFNSLWPDDKSSTRQLRIRSEV